MIHTQIQVKKTTREKLKGIKVIDRESYDSVINKLIKKQRVSDIR